jgi:CRISPR/Cas system Type II protein with McrA/HNH and RuvC-like nuclease domain
MASKSHANYMRNRAWYLAREASPEGVKKRVERDQARTKEIKAGKLSPHSKLTVDHKKPLSRGGGNATSNLALVSGKKNREKFNH